MTTLATKISLGICGCPSISRLSLFAENIEAPIVKGTQNRRPLQLLFPCGISFSGRLP
jgi:hypothetical protein